MSAADSTPVIPSALRAGASPRAEHLRRGDAARERERLGVEQPTAEPVGEDQSRDRPRPRPRSATTHHRGRGAEERQPGHGAEQPGRGRDRAAPIGGDRLDERRLDRVRRGGHQQRSRAAASTVAVTTPVSQSPVRSPMYTFPAARRAPRRTPASAARKVSSTLPMLNRFRETPILPLGDPTVADCPERPLRSPDRRADGAGRLSGALAARAPSRAAGSSCALLAAADTAPSTRRAARPAAGRP